MGEKHDKSVINYILHFEKLPTEARKHMYNSTMRFWANSAWSAYLRSNNWWKQRLGDLMGFKRLIGISKLERQMDAPFIEDSILDMKIEAMAKHLKVQFVSTYDEVKDKWSFELRPFPKRNGNKKAKS
jgi:hypothetical protein